MLELTLKVLEHISLKSTYNNVVINGYNLLVTCRQHFMAHTNI